MALDTNFALTDAPDNGVVTDTGDVWTYHPDPGFVGVDKAVYNDPVNNLIRVFQIEVLGPAPYQSVFLKDDLVATPVDEEIGEIHLLANDNGGTHLIGVSRINEWSNGDTEQGGTLTYLPSIGKGVYMYTPPSGFSGIDRFRYKAKTPSGMLTDTATCFIVVDDQTPAKPVYNITLPEETPLVLGDLLPFATYDYQIISNPSLGELNYYPGFQTITSAYGQTVSGRNMVIYEPDSGITGVDEFEIEYCPGYTADCELVKVVVDVISIATPQNDTLCAGTDCVWPGDADQNGTVDINDLLPIGFCMGEVGTEQVAGGSEYYGRHSDDWNSFTISGLGYDVKHVDTDGNGIISSIDTAAIGENYGNYHNITPVAAPPLSELPFYPGAFPGNPQPGDVILIPLYLGSSTTPAIDAYGLTFSVDYDPALFESVNVFWHDTAWMNYNSPVLHMSHKPFPGKLDAGYTRTSGIAASGIGEIGMLEFIVIDDVTGFRPNEASSTITINGNIMNSSGQTNGLGDHSLTFSLPLNEDGKDNDLLKESTADLMVYPNPATDNFLVHLNGTGQMMEQIAIYNVTGAEMYNSGNILAKRMRVDVSNLNTGIYILKVWSEGEIAYPQSQDHQIKYEY